MVQVPQITLEEMQDLRFHDVGNHYNFGKERKARVDYKNLSFSRLWFYDMLYPDKPSERTYVVHGVKMEGPDVWPEKVLEALNTPPTLTEEEGDVLTCIGVSYPNEEITYHQMRSTMPKDGTGRVIELIESLKNKGCFTCILKKQNNRVHYYWKLSELGLAFFNEQPK